MNILSIENLEKTLKDEPLFSHVTIGVENGEKVGIVGRNGTGKSTFLRLIEGEITPDEGKISMAKGLDVVLLSQRVTYDPDDTVHSYLLKGGGRRFALLRAYEEAVEKGEEGRMHSLMHEAEETDAWDTERGAEEILTIFQMPGMANRRMNTLSGGQLKKVAIARALAAKSDLLLLDEPTNHLDIATIEYLEEYLKNTTAAVIIVTHDRHILNNVATTIWELDRSRFYRHPGSYESYLERREERIDMAQKEQDRLSSILRRELIWLARGPQARTGKDKNRKDRILAMQKEQKNVQDLKQTAFSSTERRLGKKILIADGIAKSYGDNVLFKNFTYEFKKGDRIGVIGINGSGKSTLLDILTGIKAPDEGLVDIGVNTYFGYYDQNASGLKNDKTVLEYINDIAEHITFAGTIISSARFLELFGFPTALHRSPIGLLSGGERRRLYLISKLVSNPNFLILDEPTNDLDLETMENLEEYITGFTGCVLIVSHDRAFLDITTDTLFILDDLEKGDITHFPGSYTAMKEAIEEKAKSEKSEKVKAEESVRPKREKKGLSYKENLEYKALSTEIDTLNARIAELEASFATAETTADGTLAERSRKYEEHKKELAEKEDRWLELAEIAEE